MFSRFSTDVPPGYEGHPYLYMFTLFSLLLGNILALEWSWRISWALIEKRLEIRHPATVLRVILLLLLIGMLIRSGPDTLWLGLWHDMTPTDRMELLRFDERMDSVSFAPMCLAWLLAYISAPMLEFQLARFPLPTHLIPTTEQLKRPLKIGVAVFIMSAAITFVP